MFVEKNDAAVRRMMAGRRADGSNWLNGTAYCIPRHTLTDAHHQFLK